MVLTHDVMGQRQAFTGLCGCCMALLHLWGRRDVRGLFLRITASGGYTKLWVFRENFWGIVAVTERASLWAIQAPERENSDANQPLHRKLQRERGKNVTVKGGTKEWLSDRKTWGIRVVRFVLLIRFAPQGIASAKLWGKIKPLSVHQEKQFQDIQFNWISILLIRAACACFSVKCSYT